MSARDGGRAAHDPEIQRHALTEIFVVEDGSAGPHWRGGGAPPCPLKNWTRLAEAAVLA